MKNTARDDAEYILTRTLGLEAGQISAIKQTVKNLAGTDAGEGSGTTSAITAEMLMSVLGLTHEQASAIVLMIPGLVKAEQISTGGITSAPLVTNNSNEDTRTVNDYTYEELLYLYSQYKYGEPMYGQPIPPELTNALMVARQMAERAGQLPMPGSYPRYQKRYTSLATPEPITRGATRPLRESSNPLERFATRAEAEGQLRPPIRPPPQVHAGPTEYYRSPGEPLRRFGPLPPYTGPMKEHNWPRDVRDAGQPPMGPGMNPEEMPPELQLLGSFYAQEIAPRLQALGIDPMRFPDIPIEGQGQGQMQGPPGQPGMGQPPMGPPMGQPPMPGAMPGGAPPSAAMGNPMGGMPPQGMMPPQGQMQGPPNTVNPNSPELRFPWTNSLDARNRAVYTDERTYNIMFDSIEMDLQTDTIKIEDGIMTGDAVMTAAMVQDYKGKKVLKCPDELKKACEIYLAPMPCTDKHPKEGVVMSQDEIKGWTSPPMWNEDSKNVRCTVRITDGNTIKGIQDGNTDVSIGFYCDLEEKNGTYGGETHDAIQRNIVFNHLAVNLDKGHGRCPDGTCGIQREDGAPPGPTSPGAPTPGTAGSGAGAGPGSTNSFGTISPAMRQEGIESLKMIKKGMKTLLAQHKGTLSPEVEKWVKEAEQRFAMPRKKDEKDARKTTNNDSVRKEGTPMVDEDKNKNDNNVPEPKAPDAQATPKAGAPQKDEASTYVDAMIADERKKLVDTIMDVKPPRDRAHYDAKSLSDLRDLAEFLKATKGTDQTLPAVKSLTGDARAMTDAAYAAAEKELHKR